MSNIGAKLKTLAVVIAVLSGIGSVVILIVAIAEEADWIFFGVVLALAGLLGAVIMLFVLYGFGQLVENSDTVAEAFKNGIPQPVPQQNTVTARPKSVPQQNTAAVRPMSVPQQDTAAVRPMSVPQQTAVPVGIRTAAPQTMESTTPEAPKEPEEPTEGRSMEEHLEYALMFNTPAEMADYLHRILPTLDESGQYILKNFLDSPPELLPNIIHHYL